MSAAPTQISPLIKTARWGLLILGITYGYYHKKTVAKWRARERVEENRIKEEYIQQKAARKEQEKLEFERTSILYQK